MFIFGAHVEEVGKFKKQMHEGKRDYVGKRLKRVFDNIRNGTFGDCHTVHSLLYNLENGQDHYVVCFDFYDYIRA